MREVGDPGCDNGGVSPTPAQRAQVRRHRRRANRPLADSLCPARHPRRPDDPLRPPRTAAATPTRPRLHGPYHQWTRKKDGKTATRILTDDQLADYGPWFDNHRRLRELIAELEALSLAIAEADPRWNR